MAVAVWLGQSRQHSNSGPQLRLPGLDGVDYLRMLAWLFWAGLT